MMTMRYCLSVILVLLYKHYAAEAAITPSFSPEELAVCPGDQATFNCTVVDTAHSQATIWMVNVTAEQCALVHVIAFHGDTCGPFSALLGAQDGDCFPSTLTVTATTDLDNTFVQCFGPTLEAQDLVGNVTLQVVGPPSAPVLTLNEQDITSSGDTNTRNVKLHWAILDRYPEFISRYILTTAPSAQPCSGSCTLEPGSMEFMLGEYEFELTVGESYSFGIRADNCDNAQTGAMSDQLTVNLKVPLAPADCSTTPTYDQALGTLKTIDIKWDTIPVPEEIAPGIGGGVSEYEITFTSAGRDPVVDTISFGDCTAGVCSLQFISDMSVTSYTSVTVTGQNLVGSGPAGVCASQPISMMNNLLQVTIIARVVNATVECRFQSGFSGSARCRIDYGSDSMNPAYSDESSESGSAGDTVTILLSQILDPNTTYYYSVYTIGANATNVQSQGSFRSECDSADLGNTTMTLDPRCQEEGNSVTTPNGIVCYESTTADSEAIYKCNGGYQLDDGVSTRVCQQDGQWDLPVPTCTTIPPTPETESSSAGLEIWQIVVIVIAIVIVVVAVVVFTVIGIVFCLNAKAGVVLKQVDISPESHTELRNVPEGKSFEQEDDILKHVRVDTSTPVEEADGSEYSPPYQTVLAARNPTFDLSAELKEKLNQKQEELEQQEWQEEDKQALEPEDQLTTALDDQDRPEKPEYQQEESRVQEKQEEITEPSRAQEEIMEPSRAQKETTEPSRAQAEQEETTEPSRAQAEQEETTDPRRVQADLQKEESLHAIHESPKHNTHGEPPAVMKKPKSRTGNEKRVVSMEIPIYAPVAPQKTRSSIGGRASRERHYCVAINDYIPTSPEDMPIVSGELIRVTSTVTTKRWQGTTGGKKGFFPTAHVLGVNDGDIVMRAKYEFFPQDYGEIALNEGQIVVMTKQLGDGWLSGKSLSETGDYLDGRFPESYMEKIHSIQL